MHIEISNADAISFIIDPNVVTATKKDIDRPRRIEDGARRRVEKKAERLPT
jgi:phage-related tail fiber protein